MKYVNLGCGARYINEWINIDFLSSEENVISHNLLEGIPLKDNFVDVVYHSHVLEHFSKNQGEFFIKECHRVLKKGGLVRIVVPDLEQIAIHYLMNLNTAIDEDNELNEAKYNWSLLELIDQLVREKEGGEILELWKQEKLINENQIIERVGEEFSRIRKYLLNTKSSVSNYKKQNNKKFSFFKRKENNDNFSKSGEIHKWMYDRYSLQKILVNHGFVNVKIKSAFESEIIGWEKFCNLDVENGKVRKPDSLFIEAYKW